MLCFSVQANEAYLHHYPHRKNGERKLGLKFPLNSNHFVISKGNRVRLQCSASISQFYWKSAEITLLQEKPKFASVMTSGEDPVSPNEKPEDSKYKMHFLANYRFCIQSYFNATQVISILQVTIFNDNPNYKKV